MLDSKTETLYSVEGLFNLFSLEIMPNTGVA